MGINEDVAAQQRARDSREVELKAKQVEAQKRVDAENILLRQFAAWAKVRAVPFSYKAGILKRKGTWVVVDRDDPEGRCRRSASIDEDGNISNMNATSSDIKSGIADWVERTGHPWPYDN